MRADDPKGPVRTAMRPMIGVFMQLEPGMIRARPARGERTRIIAVLGAEDRRTKRGGWWHPSTVSRLLARLQARQQ
jgi:hypothetical protein